MERKDGAAVPEKTPRWQRRLLLSLPQMSKTSVMYIPDVILNAVKEVFAVFFQFVFTDSFYFVHGVSILWQPFAHIAQGGIGKDKIRRDVVA